MRTDGQFWLDRKYSYLTHRHTWKPDKNGYMVARIKTKLVYLHRLIMELELGRKLLKKQLVDHRNHIIIDCTFLNLRLTDRFGNQQNRKFRPFRGASRVGDRWQARVSHNSVEYYLGLFDTVEEAEKVALKKRRELGFLE